MAEEVPLLSPEMQMLRRNRQGGYNYRYRRHADWTESYELYRDRVLVNRLTQRQSVNLPLMKETVRSLLKDVDDMPVLYFENLDNDKQAEVFKNEYWKWTSEQNKMDLQDIVDKRQVFLFGRSFDQWQVVDGKVVMSVEDPMDILVSQYTDPFNLHSSRFLIHCNIFRPLSMLKQNKDYDQQVISDLEQWYTTQMGVIKLAENAQILVEKNQKMADMGVNDISHPVVGETYVELALHFVWRDDELDEKGNKLDEQIFLYVVAENMQILMKKPLEEIIGTTSDHFFRSHYPYCSWGDDLERQDFWSDGIADIVRTPNKILNSWFSQLVENRTLKNFNMNIFNSSIEGFNPQTWNAIPWGMYGIPVGMDGNIRDAFQPLPVADLKDSLDEMTFVIQMLEKATGATATQQGQQTERQVTLGEVQLALGEAKERIKGMSKFYTPAWKERGTMFIKLLEAAGDRLDAVKIYKKGLNTNKIYSREISHTDWETKSGYGVRVWSQDEKQAADTDEINKLNAVKANIPNNPKLDEIFKRKLLEFAGLKPDEMNDVMRYEEKKLQAEESGENQKQPDPESLSMNYKDAPPDIQRQMEKAAGFTPSSMGLQQTPTPPSADSQMQGAMPQQPGQPMTQAPAPQIAPPAAPQMPGVH